MGISSLFFFFFFLNLYPLSQGFAVSNWFWSSFSSMTISSLGTPYLFQIMTIPSFCQPWHLKFCATYLNSFILSFPLSSLLQSFLLSSVLFAPECFPYILSTLECLDRARQTEQARHGNLDFYDKLVLHLRVSISTNNTFILSTLYPWFLISFTLPISIHSWNFLLNIPKI